MSGKRDSVVSAIFSLAGLCSSAHAQDVSGIDNEYFSFRGVAVEYGHLWADRVMDTPSYGARFDLGYVVTGVRIVPTIMYWSSPMNQDEIVEFQDRVQALVAKQNDGVRPTLDLGRIDYTDIAIGADAHVVWELPMDILTFGGLGVTAHLMDGDGDVIRGTFVEDLLDSVEPGFNLHLGTEYPITDGMRFYANGRYEVMPNLQYFQVRLGWQLMWGSSVPGEGRGSN